MNDDDQLSIDERDRYHAALIRRTETFLRLLRATGPRRSAVLTTVCARSFVLMLRAALPILGAATRECFWEFLHESVRRDAWLCRFCGASMDGEPDSARAYGMCRRCVKEVEDEDLLHQDGPTV